MMLSHWKEMKTQMTGETRRQQVLDRQTQHNNSQLSRIWRHFGNQTGEVRGVKLNNDTVRG